MTFEIGDRVVHPRHGLGNVVKLAEKQFEPGVTRKYYEISIPGSTLWVPLDLPLSGLRRLTVKSEIAHCRRILQAPATPLNENPRLRQSDMAAHLQEGTISAQCEVVRDLSASDKHKPLYGPIAMFLRVTQDVLCQEWATVEGISLSDAASEIGTLLQKGRQKAKESTT